MQEACYCGRTGDMEDRGPILDSGGRKVLRCPDCDHLGGLPDDARLLVLREAERRWRIGHRYPARRGRAA